MNWLQQATTLYRREVSALVRSPAAWAIAATVLWIDGLLFQAFALGATSKLSTKVLEDFLYFATGTTIIASILVSMRAFTDERAAGTMPLLLSSPIDESAIVIGKFAASWTYLTALTLATSPMPALIFVHGRVSLAHIALGMASLLLVAGATLSIGTMTSAWARSQLVAGAMATVLIVALLLAWMLARISEPPLRPMLQALALFDAHLRPMQRGLLRASDLVYFAAIMALSLAAARRSVAAQRWS